MGWADLASLRAAKALEWLINTTWMRFCFNPDWGDKISNTAKRKKKKFPLKKILKFPKE